MRLPALAARVVRQFRWLSKPRGATNRQLEHHRTHDATTLPPNLHGGGYQG
jgi:hypothetical protein